MLISDLLTALAGGWDGDRPKMWGEQPLYQGSPEDTTDNPVDLPATPPRRVIGSTDSLEALASRDKAIDETSPLPTRDQIQTQPSYQTSEGRSTVDAGLRPTTPDMEQPSSMATGNVNRDYNIFGEDRQTAEHTTKGRLKQIGRAALMGLSQARPGQGGLGSILGNMAGAALGGAIPAAIKPSIAGTMYEKGVVEPRVKQEEAEDYANKLKDAKLAEMASNEAYKTAEIGALQAKPQKHYVGYHNPVQGYGVMETGSGDVRIDVPGQDISYIDPVTGVAYDGQGNAVKNAQGNVARIAREKTSTPKVMTPAQIGQVAKQKVAEWFTPEEVAASSTAGENAAGTAADRLTGTEKTILAGQPTQRAASERQMTAGELTQWQKEIRGKTPEEIAKLPMASAKQRGVVPVGPHAESPSPQEQEAVNRRVSAGEQQNASRNLQIAKGKTKQYEGIVGERFRQLTQRDQMSPEDALDQIESEREDITKRVEAGTSPAASAAPKTKGVVKDNPQAVYDEYVKGRKMDSKKILDLIHKAHPDFVPQ